MNYQTITTLLFAGCCLFAVVSMAATLEHGVQGTPDDVIDVDMDTLPLPSDQAEQLKQSVQSSSRPAESGGTGTAESDSGSDRPGSSTSDSDAGDTSGQTNGGSSGSSVDSSSDTTKGGSVPSAPDGLLALLRQLLQRLLGVLGGLLLLGVLGLAAYKRDLLWQRLRDVLGRTESRSAAHGTATRARRSPENQVEQLWAQMLSVAGIADEPHETPRESADAAVEAGLRREPVRELTALFEHVRYGEKPVTTEDVQRASNYLRGTLPEDDD